ncbi:MAG TPA: hypothetical protein VF157_00530 [Chloroflexota bacterium]
MVLLVAPNRTALPAVTVPSRHRTLILRSRGSALESRIQAALGGGEVDLVISLGFAAAADRRLSPGDLLLATRVYGGSNVYLDMPPLQAPGAVRGSLSTLVESPDPGRVLLRPRRRLPPVYAYDDHGFWLARGAQAAHVPCLMLRSILLEASTRADTQDPLLGDLLTGSVGRLLLRQPQRWREIRDLLRHVDRCRAQLASALAVLMVLHGSSQ